MAILVTGVGRGIGRAIALAFAVPGATVAIAARTPAQLEETARAIEQRGAKPLPLALDVTDEHAVARAFEEIEGACGSTLEVLVNNAGVGGGLPIHKTGHRELAPHPRDECVGHVSRVAARRAADARRRPDHQHVVGARTVR